MRIRIFLIAAAALALAVVAGLFAPELRTGSQPAGAIPREGEAVASPTAGESPATPPATTSNPVATEGEPILMSAPPLDVVYGPPSWDPQVKAAALERDAAARSKALLALLPRMPVEALAEVAEKAVDTLPDRAYAETALPVVTNPTTAGQVLSVLFADLMERPDGITLPALLQIARDPQHPFGPSALDNLRLLLRVDRGTDWAAWDQDIQREISVRR